MRVARPLEQRLDEDYAKEGGFAKFAEMVAAREDGRETLRSIARQFRDRDLSTIQRWINEDRQEAKR